MLFSLHVLLVTYRLRGLPFPFFFHLFVVVTRNGLGAFASEHRQRGGNHHRVDIAVEASVPPCFEAREEKHQLGCLEVGILTRDYPRALFQLRIGEFVFTAAVLG